MKLPQWAKGMVAAIGAVAGVLVPLLADGRIEGAEWGTVIVAVLTALGVAVVPNAITDRQRDQVVGPLE